MRTEECVTAAVTPTPQNLIKALKQKTIVIHRQPQEDRERERERESICSADTRRKEVTVKREMRKCLYKGAGKYGYGHCVYNREM